MDHREQRESASMNRRTVIAVTLGLALSALPFGNSRAATSETTCVWSHDVFAEPGLSAQPSSGSWTSRGPQGETGTISCDGPIHGKKPTGPGILEARGRYGTQDGDTCQTGGEGDALWSLIFPTADGTVHFVDPFTFRYGAFSTGAPFAVEFSGDQMKGSGEVQSFEGDCAANAVTKYHAKGQVTIKS
jgi:hypothetical protein